MTYKKNWFYYFGISFSIIGFLYIFVGSITSLGEAQEYPYLPKGLLILGIFLGWILVLFLSRLMVRFRLDKLFAGYKKRAIVVEGILVVGVLLSATMVRVWVIQNFPITPTSDYKTYYEIADLLLRGTIQKEGKGYCDYIAMFPHVYGYCSLLKMAFAIWGTSTVVGLNLNLFFSVATVFLIYRIGRRCGGRIAGMIAMLLCAFWPSQMLYSSILSAEPSFTFLIFLCADLFLALTLPKDHSVRVLVGYLILGVLIALAAAVRPMAMILLIAIALCIIPQKNELPAKPINDIPLIQRFLRWGWVRCVLIFIPYMIVSNIISTNIELTINRDLASGSTSFGYNLLVGLNTESVGGWNEEDKDLLYDTMEETGSASSAHLACRDLAIQRLISNPVGIFNLFIQKYELLWGNDDYGTTWNIAFSNEQGNLTQWRSDFLYQMRDINNIVYTIAIFFAMVGLLFLYKGKGNYLFVFVLVYLGTVAMHLFVESQNRYHYFVLQVFMLLAGFGIQSLYADVKKEAAGKRQIQEKEALEGEAREKQLNSYKKVEDEIAQIRSEALENVFDMKRALENGNIVMTVSEAYAEDENAADTVREHIVSLQPEKSAATPEPVVETPMMREQDPSARGSRITQECEKQKTDSLEDWAADVDATADKSWAADVELEAKNSYW